MSKRSCIVVGAGISGLLAARELQDAGWRAVVLDKSRGIGGRMATRRLGEACFDHGAQFFTVRDERFGKLNEGWLDESASVEWSRGFAVPGGEPSQDGHPRYRGVGGMTSIPKHLARGLDVRTGERVAEVNPRNGGWYIACESGLREHGGSLLLTAPAPQSLALAESGNFAPSDEVREQLGTVSYGPCLALMAILEGPSAVPEPGGVQIKSEPLDWVGDNQQKGISSVPAVTVHAGPEWSRAHFDDAEEEVTASLLSLAGRWLGSRVVETSLARWRYSWVNNPHPEPYLLAQEDPPLVFCGDAFGQPKVEGAALSGLAAADALLGRGE